MQMTQDDVRRLIRSTGQYVRTDTTMGKNGRPRQAMIYKSSCLFCGKDILSNTDELIDATVNNGYVCVWHRSCGRIKG